MVEEFNRLYHGKLHVDGSIKEKLEKGIRLDPEEHKINYRLKAVRYQQKRVMDHIFRDRPFKLSDLDQLKRWLRDDEAEKAFFNSQLVPGPDGKDVPLSHSTITTFA